MANAFITPLEITREFLDILHSNIVIAKNMDRRYEHLFGNAGVALAGKIGPTLNIRKPNQVTIRSGWTMQQQDITEQYVPLTVDTPFGVDLQFDDASLALTIDDFSERYIEPAAKRMAAELDMRAGLFILNNTFSQVGEYDGTTDTTTPSKAATFTAAHALIKKNLAPVGLDEVSAIISPDTEASIVPGLSGLYNPQNVISKQFMSGEMIRALGLNFEMSQVLSAHTNGTRTDSTPVTSTFTSLPALGTSSLTITGGGTLTYKAGDLLTIAGVYNINPETKQQYNSLKQFVVTADTTSVNSGFSLPIAPAIYTSGPLQNCYATTAASKAIVNSGIGATGGAAGSGVASYTYANDLVLHKRAFALATVPLELPRGLDMAERASSDGISVRFLRGYDMINARQLSRMDIFYGMAALRPEWSVRVRGLHA